MSSNVSKVRVCQEEFESAKAFDCVYGKTSVGMVTAYVYVELGNEGDYRDHHSDDLNTSYRIFFNCTVHYAKTEEDLDACQYECELPDRTVKIMCKLNES